MTVREKLRTVLRFLFNQNTQADTLHEHLEERMREICREEIEKAKNKKRDRGQRGSGRS